MQVARSAMAQSFPAASSSQPAMYANTPPGMKYPPAFNRSFSDLASFPQQNMDKPQIYTVRTSHSYARAVELCS